MLAACDQRRPTEVIVDPPVPQPSLQLGDPLPDLTSDERAAFERGKALFSKRFKPSEGLGPFYNATSCESCHSDPVAGGSAALYRNFYLVVQGELPGLQGPLPGLPSVVMPAFGTTSTPNFTLEGGRLPIPQQVGGRPVVVAQRNSIPLFGVGLFEFIANATILANADPDDLDQDGISGRNNNDAVGVGRFGMKAQSNNIEFFTRAPLMNQMGITSDPFRGSAGTISFAPGMAPQAPATPNATTRDNDGVPDPEISPQDLGDLIAFTRFLAPPQPQPFDDAARRGAGRFTAIGCAKCHVPELASARGPVRAFTDLLLHDMGSSLADHVSFGRPQVAAAGPLHNGSEFRTAPLWGVSKFAPYLHDGRAATLDDAIRAHGGEATAIRNAYAALAQGERDDLLAFLRSL